MLSFATMTSLACLPLHDHITFKVVNGHLRFPAEKDMGTQGGTLQFSQ